MKIAILLPYKENYSKFNAGAVSIFVNDTVKLSKYKQNIKVYGSTNEKNVLYNYQNINFNKKFYQSSSNQFLKKFLNLINQNIYIFSLIIILLIVLIYSLSIIFDLKNINPFLYFNF